MLDVLDGGGLNMSKDKNIGLRPVSAKPGPDTGPALR